MYGLDGHFITRYRKAPTKRLTKSRAGLFTDMNFLGENGEKKKNIWTPTYPWTKNEICSENGHDEFTSLLFYRKKQ
jgi:hypothetical protein